MINFVIEITNVSFRKVSNVSFRKVKIDSFDS